MAAIPNLAPGPNQPDYRGTERRRAERLQVLLPAKLVLMDGEFDCAIEDVSQSGARLIADASLRERQQGILRCLQLDTMFEVIWVRGKSAGVQFDSEVPLGIVRMLRWDNDVNRAAHDAELRAIVSDWSHGISR